MTTIYVSCKRALAVERPKPKAKRKLWRYAKAMRGNSARGYLAAAVLLLSVTLLTGCMTPPPENNFPELTWTHKKPYFLAVSEVVIEQQYRTRSQLPNMEERAPLAPVKAAADWAADRLQAVGSGGRARFIILDGSILRNDLKTKGGLTGLFTNDQSRQYDGRIAVELIITDAQGNTTGQVWAEARHSRSIAENATLNQRDRTLFRMVEQIMRNLDAELDKEIPRYLGASLR